MPEIGFLEQLFSSLDQAFCLCEVIAGADGRPRDYRFLAVNARFEAMTGLTEATGRTARELEPGLDPFFVATYGRVGLDRVPARFQRPASPTGRWFDVAAAPFGGAGRFVVVFRDITEAKRVEDGRVEALERTEALLRELNHRVMNSLGMIASIVGLESRARVEGEGRRALERIADRVHAVGDLYRTLAHAGSETEVRADDYLGRVVDRLAASVADGVRIEAAVEPIYLSTRVAAPIGLIVTELVTNCLRHAFGSEGRGTVRVALVRKGDALRLAITDDGFGCFAEHPEGIGRKLVAAFARQLDGEVAIADAGSGTAVTVDFPLPPAEEPSDPAEVSKPA